MSESAPRKARSAPLSLFLTFDVESKRSENYITCEHVPGAPGTYWIMDELERHGCRGVFFVNVYEHGLYPDGWMQAFLRDIHERGHEVALHCHQPTDLDFYTQGLRSYDVAGQTRILQYGVDFIREATGVAPVSFRAGAFRLNDDTFRALEACGLSVDSSLLFHEPNNDVNGYESVNKAARYGAVLEVPVTHIARGRRAPRLDLNQAPDREALPAALAQMIAAGCDEAVFLGHSFSFVLYARSQSRGLPGIPRFKEGKYTVGEDDHLKSAFVDLLKFVQSRPQEIRSALLRDAAAGGLPSAGPDYRPRVPDNRLATWPRFEDYTAWRRRRWLRRRGTYRSQPRRLVLHVGTWKTGSKALQRFWSKNRSVLNRHGIDYPLDPRAAYAKGGNLSYQSRILAEPEEGKTSPIESFGREIDAGRFDMCLLSHENLCNQPRQKWLDLVSTLAGWEFQVVVYLRRQDLYAQSLYNQHVKGNVRYTGTFEAHFQQFRGRYDYRSMVERLGSVFGAESLVVRPYEREQFHGGTIFSDFMHHAFDLDSDPGFALPERDSNARLDADALEFKRFVNGTTLAVDEKREVGRALVAYCESVDETTRRAFVPHELISPKRHREVIDTFAEGNAWVARHYLPDNDGALFLEPRPDDGEGWAEYSGLTPEKAAEIGAFLYRYEVAKRRSSNPARRLLSSLRQLSGRS